MYNKIIIINIYTDSRTGTETQDISENQSVRQPIIAAVISAIIAIVGPLALTDIVADAQQSMTSQE